MGRTLHGFLCHGLLVEQVTRHHQKVRFALVGHGHNPLQSQEALLPQPLSNGVWILGERHADVIVGKDFPHAFVEDVERAKIGPLILNALCGGSGSAQGVGMVCGAAGPAPMRFGGVIW